MRHRYPRNDYGSRASHDGQQATAPPKSMRSAAHHVRLLARGPCLMPLQRDICSSERNNVWDFPGKENERLILHRRRYPDGAIGDRQ